MGKSIPATETAPRAAAELEAVLGHRFRDAELLERARTHRSLVHEMPQAAAPESKALADNQSLEFLGDAVLGLVTSQTLFERFPQHREGELSKLKAHLVSARHLAKVASDMDLGRYLRLGRGEEKSGGRQKSALLADALEAVLAALYLDGGLDAARGFVMRRILIPELQRLSQPGEEARITDYKSALQELMQSRGESQPVYVLSGTTGPAHERSFTVEIRLRSEGSDFTASGEGATKKNAEQKAAKRALERLNPASKTVTS